MAQSGASLPMEEFTTLGDRYAWMTELKIMPKSKAYKRYKAGARLRTTYVRHTLPYLILMEP